MSSAMTSLDEFALASVGILPLEGRLEDPTRLRPSSNELARELRRCITSETASAAPVVNVSQLLSRAHQTLEIADWSFVGWDLSSADFSGCRITRCNFERADLSRSRFTGAAIQDCEFAQSTLARADLRDAAITNCGFARADLREVFAPNAAWHTCDFTGANLWAARISRSALDACWVEQEQVLQLDSRVQ